MLQEPGHAIPQSSHEITLNSASRFHLHSFQRSSLTFSPKKKQNQLHLKPWIFFLRGFK
uniref:Uncharacterized protein n=1 Tax=Canis lupus familiaris TaxID=9615 RepID=A0A8C0RPR0_CANLF